MFAVEVYTTPGGEESSLSGIIHCERAKKYVGTFKMGNNEAS